MKKIYILLAAAGVMSFSSCSKDYLNTLPTDSVKSEVAFATVDNVRHAVNGLYKAMTEQYNGFGQGYNGEGTVKYYLGNIPSNSFHRYSSSYSDLIDNTFCIDPQYKQLQYIWFYYYRLIGNANDIIDHAGSAHGAPDQIAYMIGQAKVMRAFAYLQLSQHFHYRWSMDKHSEAKNGNGLVLRVKSTNDPLAEKPQGLASADDTYAQIYKDLDEAIVALSNGSIERDEIQENYHINLDVAYAVYARAALTRADYATALKYARLAKENHPLMSNSDYVSGFNTPNQEWIWSSYGGITENMFYYGFFAYQGYNSSASQCKKYPKYIDRAVFEKIPENDIRRTLFLDPENMKFSTSNMRASTNGSLYKKAFELHPDLNYAAYIVAYHAFKFKHVINPGIGHLNHFRSSEMYLIEAEANYFLGNIADAQAALVGLNTDSDRNPEYTCELEGEELLAEIKYYRSLELWGEGFEWGDLKRWNDPIDRKTYSHGGSSYSKYAIHSEQDESNNFWTCVIPENETNYNPSI